MEKAFKDWIHGLLEEGYDLSDYTWDEVYEVYEETMKEKKEKEERINNRRARVAEMQARGEVMTSSKRASAKAKERREAKRQEAAEKILRQLTGGKKVSEKPMGSEAPAPKEAAPAATRRLRTGLMKDNLGKAADDILKSLRKEEIEMYNIIVEHLIEGGYAENVEAAHTIINHMSEEWVQDIVEGYKKLPVGRMIKQAARKGGKVEALNASAVAKRSYNDLIGAERINKQVKKMARVASRHSLIKGKGKVRGEGQAKLNRVKGETKVEGYELYDLLVSHLISEGYAENLEKAEFIVSHMSDEWLEEIIEGYKKLPIEKMMRKVAKISSRGETPAGRLDARIAARKRTNKMAKVAGEHDPKVASGKGRYNRWGFH